jgi:hypothetical protein
VIGRRPYRQAAIEARRAQIRAVIGTAGSRFVSVVFVKKDGTLRVMRWNPADHRDIKGDAATDAGKRANATRKANNPNLIRVQEVKKGWRSVNLDRIIRIRVDGVTSRFQLIKESW